MRRRKRTKCDNEKNQYRLKINKQNNNENLNDDILARSKSTNIKNHNIIQTYPGGDIGRQ